jgi:spore coat polysaccharide biosynthesis protein SpsF
MNDNSFRTEQEAFWAGEFGRDYISRNKGEQLLASNLNFFSQALRSARPINSCVEFGANIGMNLRALKLLYPAMGAKAIEINPDAAAELSQWLGGENVFCGSILDWAGEDPSDLALIKGVLIHINPEHLDAVYAMLHKASKRYILVAEYYNPVPVALPYRGHDDRLFKRDFAGEILDSYGDLHLLDYGFAYHRDPSFPQDDINWFLLEKKG